jgi:hypothetical protein
MLVRHLRLSLSGHFGAAARKVEALLPVPGGQALRHRLPFLTPPPDKDLPAPAIWSDLGSHVKVLDLHLRYSSQLLTFSSVLERLSAVSTIRNHDFYRTRRPEDNHFELLPRCDVYVSSDDFPPFQLGHPVCVGGRIVFTHPFSVFDWKLLGCVSDLEIVFIFPYRHNYPVFIPDEEAQDSVMGFSKRLGRAIAGISKDPRPQITLANLSSWSPEGHVGVQRLVQLAFTMDGSDSVTTTDEKMACLRFQTLEEYCSRVGEDQVRLELGPELTRRLRL